MNSRSQSFRAAPTVHPERRCSPDTGVALHRVRARRRCRTPWLQAPHAPGARGWCPRVRPVIGPPRLRTPQCGAPKPTERRDQVTHRRFRPGIGPSHRFLRLYRGSRARPCSHWIAAPATNIDPSRANAGPPEASHAAVVSSPRVGGDSLRPRIEQKKGAGPVGALARPRLPAALPVERRLLIARHAADRYCRHRRQVAVASTPKSPELGTDFAAGSGGAPPSAPGARRSSPPSSRS